MFWFKKKKKAEEPIIQKKAKQKPFMQETIQDRLKLLGIAYQEDETSMTIYGINGNSVSISNKMTIHDIDNILSKYKIGY
jgi:hypothetical protein